MDLDMHDTVEALGAYLREQRVRMATAESCTGGLTASTLTDVAGSSDWFEGGVVAYDNRVKTGLLGVPQDILVSHGAVSRECVEAMAQGVCDLLRVPVGVAISALPAPAAEARTNPWARYGWAGSVSTGYGAGSSFFRESAAR